MQDNKETYAVTASVQPVDTNGVRLTFTDMSTNALIEWEVFDIGANTKGGMNLIYAAFNDDTLNEMLEMIETATKQAREMIEKEKADGTAE